MKHQKQALKNNSSDFWTYQEARNIAINQYPSLYGGKKLPEASLRYADHVFNCIGAGFSDLEDWKEQMMRTEEGVLWSEAPIAKYVSGEPLFYVYVGEGEECLPGIYSQVEVNAMINVKDTIQSNREDSDDGEKRPKGVPHFYPNFKKTYSWMWKTPEHVWLEIDRSWPEAALTFYQTAKDFFEGEHAWRYHEGVPPDTKKFQAAWKRRIGDMEKMLERYKVTKEGVQRTPEEWKQEVSRAYGVPFNGDIKAFLQQRAEESRLKALVFIDETIVYMQRVLSMKDQQALTSCVQTNALQTTSKKPT
jgi:hypothetical protein